MDNKTENKDTLKMPKQTLITVVLAFISFGGISHVLGWWEAGIAREDSYIDLYKKELQNHAKTRYENAQLKASLSVLNGNIIELPFPFWIKDLESNIIYLNDPYENQILSELNITKLDIIGTQGQAMVGDAELQKFIANDQLVLRTGLTQTKSESVNGRTGISFKFPIRKSGKIILMGGCWIENIQFIE